MTKAERKAFRSQMWAFRRDPESLTAEEQQALEGLFETIPKLKELYRVRLRFKEIFDTARDRTTAARWLRQLRRETEDLGLDLGPFFATYDRWKTEILNYFDARQTSAAVEGINNKARVITKRAYGLKSADSLWTRLILDLNRASEAIGWSIEQIRQMARRAEGPFRPVLHLKTEQPVTMPRLKTQDTLLGTTRAADYLGIHRSTFDPLGGGRGRSRPTVTTDGPHGVRHVYSVEDLTKFKEGSITTRSS